MAYSLRNESRKANDVLGQGRKFRDPQGQAGNVVGGGDWAWSKNGETVENGGECGKVEAARPIQGSGCPTVSAGFCLWNPQPGVTESFRFSNKVKFPAPVLEKLLCGPHPDTSSGSLVCDPGLAEHMHRAKAEAGAPARVGDSRDLVRQREEVSRVCEWASGRPCGTNHSRLHAPTRLSAPQVPAADGQGEPRRK